MKRKIATVYAIFCTLLMAAGFVTVFYFAWKKSVEDTSLCLIGFALGFVLAGVVHELGHLVFGKANGMTCVFWKAFCLQVRRNRGKLKFAFASPFTADQTQMLPKNGGDMQKRASFYALGGLIFSGILVAALLCVALLTGSFLAWGMLPFSAHLLLLNAAPVEYVGGKTDALVYRGIKSGEDVEKCMLASMEIQGQISEGRSFSEIEQGLYFDLPTICEDEPLFAMLCDLRYRYYLDCGDLKKAAEALNRLAQIEEYLPQEEGEKIAAEFVYMHTLNADMGAADACGMGCKDYLKSDCVSAKRILAAYSAAFGKSEAVAPLKAQAEELMFTEPLGAQKFEKRLLDRIKA